MKNFKSGTYINQGYYRSFQPNFINKSWEISDMEVVTLLSKADRMHGRLDMYSEHIPNIDLFISMHVMKEATQSSKIEGTQTNMEEAILSNDISEWFKFFLTGIIKTAENGVRTFEEILLLQKENEEKIKSLGSRSANALKIVTELYKLPIIDANKVASITGISNASAYTLISSMEKCGILSEVTGGRRGRIYMLKKYFDIFNK